MSKAIVLQLDYRTSIGYNKLQNRTNIMKIAINTVIQTSHCYWKFKVHNILLSSIFLFEDLVLDMQ